MNSRQKNAIIMVVFGLFSSFLPILASNQDEGIPFIVRTASGPGKLDPIDAYDSESIEAIMQVVEELYMYNYGSSEMETIPCLASGVGIWSPDVKELTIPLKKSVTFHDGTKFNASAVKWNFDLDNI